MNGKNMSAAVAADLDGLHGEVVALIKALCAIPAPSHHEEQRAQYIKAWFEAQGMTAFVDEALNVLCPFGLEEHEEMVVIMAHTDTVFPDMEPMPLREEDGKLYCPGVGDDTTNVAVMMQLAAYLHRTGAKPTCGVLFVANSCEEGLGNLKGCKAIMQAYGKRVKAFLSLDGDFEHVCNSAVGSSRYKVTAKTQGGHSFADFGNKNAIAVLAQLISALYGQTVPQRTGTTTTYNVGLISGGTSVNTIAQQAEMLYEYRSNDAACLEIMERQFRQILDETACDDAEMVVELLGLRPCGQGVDEQKQAALEQLCCGAITRWVGESPSLSSGSTDCNIPLSLGIPSACFGVYRGAGEHTREEWVEIDSILPGMKAAADVIFTWFE